MHCRPCQHQQLISNEQFLTTLRDQQRIDVPSAFSAQPVLEHHQRLRTRINSQPNHDELVFFKNGDPKHREMNRPVLLRSSSHGYTEKESLEHDDRPNVYLTEMRANWVYHGRQLSVWIVTPAALTTMLDGTIYLTVRDAFHFHIRLVISNWSYFVPGYARKSPEALTRLLDDLLPVNSLVMLLDPHLTKCTIDGQLSVRCDAPNLNLILVERTRKRFVVDKLDELRDRGNQAYIQGDTQLALDYYTFAINRLTVMAGMVASQDNEVHLDLFLRVSQVDFCRLHANRAACYLRERLYSGASADATMVTTGQLLDQAYDKNFFKSLYRLICANYGLNDYSIVLDTFFLLYQEASISRELRQMFTEDFAQLRSVLASLRQEHELGNYDLKSMFTKESVDQSTSFDLQRFHANYKNDRIMKKKNHRPYARRAIPPGTLLLAQQAFVFVKTGDHAERRLLNEIEKRLNMASTINEFNALRQMPSIRQWFEEETEVDPEWYPETIPWRVLLKSQRKNRFRSKDLIGWWPEGSMFTSPLTGDQKGNCLWFICGTMLFVFTLRPVEKNDRLVMAENNSIEVLLREQQQHFTFLLGSEQKISLAQIFDDLHRSQWFFTAR